MIRNVSFWFLSVFHNPLLDMIHNSTSINFLSVCQDGGGISSYKTKVSNEKYRSTAFIYTFLDKVNI